MHLVDTSLDLDDPKCAFNMSLAGTIAHPFGKSKGNVITTRGAEQCPLTSAPPCLAGMRIYQKAQEEFDQIQKAHHVLAPTGCTPQFCQAGRATRLNETRVGRNRPIAEIEQEAIGFLRECREQGVIRSDEELNSRMEAAASQIRSTSITSFITDTDGQQTMGLAGGVWQQTAQELEYGIRASWRNARRCIMRSKFDQLVLCDLRHVTSSKGMAEAIVDGICKAYNGGRIIPTTFVFPPRSPDKRGPMVWNHQILAFAGYQLEDGSVLGDPNNTSVTSAMIELGWKSPTVRSRWDLLPVVTMAEGEAPYLLELPTELRRTVQIMHPRYRDEFKDLDLKWVLAPALSRLGFDIGGNQYTASPFIGWFMDAEIGVRNLADTFRYNALPEIASRLQLTDDSNIPFEDLPEYMRLAALSRAQTELNFAVYHSYLHARVTMVDSLTSAADYQKFDLERRDDTGYRLPADPYWLSPPQGSIVPLWHQGGAPNYQPKPMIARHVQDPIKAWNRECPIKLEKDLCGNILRNEAQNIWPTIRIFTCSAGVGATKMAKKLYERLKNAIAEQNQHYLIEPEKALNALIPTNCHEKDIILIIASTTGQGEIPRNGLKFLRGYQKPIRLDRAPSFSVFGNGDSTYGDTYNVAGKEIRIMLKKIGVRPLFDWSFDGDTALNNPDWTSFSDWTEAIICSLGGKPFTKSGERMSVKTNAVSSPTLPVAKLEKVDRWSADGLLQVTLDVGDKVFQEMDHVKIITPNSDSEVAQALTYLGLEPDEILEWHGGTAYDLLSGHVDLDSSFKSLHWYPCWQHINEASRQDLKRLKVNDLLATISQPWSRQFIELICKDMASIRPRVYSVASSPSQVEKTTAQNSDTGNKIEIIVKVNPGGRFSDTFLQQAQPGTGIRFALQNQDSWPVIRDQWPGAPFIAVTTGSGIGPVRAILQHRLANSNTIRGRAVYQTHELETISSSILSSASVSLASSRSSSVRSSRSSSSSCACFELSQNGDQPPVADENGMINLFAGFKPHDAPLINSIVLPVKNAGMFNMLELVPSNRGKERVQDRLLTSENSKKLSKLLQHPSCVVFVCTNEAAAAATAANLSSILGTDVRDFLQERYIEEVFRC